jgi:RNA polymerase sigma factor (sigma-70 family)
MQSPNQISLTDEPLLNQNVKESEFKKLLDDLRSPKESVKTAAFRELYRLAYPQVRHAIMLSGGNDEDALDMMQEAILRLWAKYLENTNFSFTAKPSTILVAIAKNRWLDTLKKKNLTKPSRGDEWEQIVGELPQDGLVHIVDAKDKTDGNESKDKTDNNASNLEKILLGAISEDLKEHPLLDKLRGLLVLHKDTPCVKLFEMYFAKMPMTEIALKLRLNNAAVARSKKAECIEKFYVLLYGKKPVKK